jgi:glycosyltransferase involved in cell wall biosynthesis
MKILFVSCCLPYPQVAHGGGVDLFHLIESLSERHEVHLLATITEEEQPHVDGIKPYCHSLKVVRPALTWRAKLKSAWRTLPTNPLLIGRRARTEIKSWIRGLIEEEGIEVVQFEWTGAGQFVGAVSPDVAATVLDEVDVSFRPKRRLVQLARSPWAKIWAWWAYHRTRRWELDICRRFDAILTRSATDREALRFHLPQAHISILQPWTYVARFADIAPHESEPHTLLFVGAMDRDENCQAIIYFYERCFAQIEAAVPGVELLIVGASPQPRVQNLGGPQVTVTGYVDDLRPYYARCRVFIAPILVGGGVINKIVDAMGAGRPVVSTSVGNEGLGATPDREILIADDPIAFARQTIALLQDKELWSRIALGGRRHVQRIYNWERNVANLEDLYRHLVRHKLER